MKRPEDTDCDLILVEAPASLRGVTVDLGRQWRRIWDGDRPADRRNRFILYQRVGATG